MLLLLLFMILWCWRRHLRVPWTVRRSNQSTLKEISPEYSLEGLLLKWKLQYFGHFMRRVDSFEKTLMMGKIEGRRWRGRQRKRCWMTSLTQWTWVWVNSGSWWWTGRPGMCSPWGRKELDTTERLIWTDFYCGFPGGASVKEPTCQCRKCKDEVLISAIPEGMATHSGVLAWRISRTEGPGGLQSKGSPKTRHNLAPTHTLILLLWLV